MDQRFLTTQQAAEFLGLRPNTMERWRLVGRGPEFVRLGRAIRYDKQTLEEFAAAGRSRSTAEYRNRGV